MWHLICSGYLSYPSFFLLSEGGYFRGDRYFRDLLTPVTFYRYFWRFATFEGFVTFETLWNKYINENFACSPAKSIRYYIDTLSVQLVTSSRYKSHSATLVVENPSVHPYCSHKRAVFWIWVTSRFSLMFSRWPTNHFGIVLSALTTIGTTLVLTVHSFFSSLARHPVVQLHQ